MHLRKILLESVLDKCGNTLQVKVNQFLKPPTLETKVSPFSVAVLENGAIGLSYNLFHGEQAAMARYRDWDLQNLIGQTATEAAHWLLSDDLLKRTAGLAVLNALSQDFMHKHPELYRIEDSCDLFRLMGLNKSSRLGLVAYFRPLINRLLDKAGEVIVLEKSAELLQGSYPFTMTDDPAALERCDKVLVTATTVTNDSLPGLMSHCSNADFVAIMGPTAGFLPDTLFALGIHAEGYSRIEDSELFLQRFSSGVKWGDATRKVWALAN